MITAEALNKHFDTPEGRVAALHEVSFRVEEGAFFVLLGASGSGKTTTLRALAGLDDPDTGRIDIAGRPVFDAAHRLRVSPERRPIAMVFQSYALWPHMDVHGNIAFPLRRGLRRVAAAEVERRVARVIDLLDLGRQVRRPIAQLSGGQQQRVALARALALEPAVLLMDEPLSNLDARLRAQLRVELKRLTAQIGITTVYVTHDQTEAMVMGDRIAVMHHGQILQEGTPQELYCAPRDLFVARFLGEMNFIDGVVETSDGSVATVRAGTERLTAHGENLPRAGHVTIGFRQEDAVVAQAPGDNVLAARITARHYLGDSYLYDLQAGAAALQVRRPNTECLEPGATILLHVPPQRCLAYGAPPPPATDPLDETAPGD